MIEANVSRRDHQFHEARMTDQYFANTFPPNSSRIVGSDELRAPRRKTFVAAVDVFAFSIVDFAGFEGYSKGGGSTLRSFAADLAFVHSSSESRPDAPGC